MRKVWWRHLFLLVVVAFALLPIVFVVSAALNPIGTLSTSQVIPTGASLHNFAKLFSDPDHSFGRWFLNSVLIALTASGASVLLSIMAAYAFSRYA